MIDIEDRSHQPELWELRELVGVPLFDELDRYMDSEFKALRRIEYSGDKVLLGWNLKYKKAGRTLCTVYPRRGHFPMLLIVGRGEKERVETLLPSFSEGFRSVYEGTREGMGQRWLLLDFAERTDVYDDALRVIHIRRERDTGSSPRRKR